MIIKCEKIHRQQLFYSINSLEVYLKNVMISSLYQDEFLELKEILFAHLKEADEFLLRVFVSAFVINHNPFPMFI